MLANPGPGGAQGEGKRQEKSEEKECVAEMRFRSMKDCAEQCKVFGAIANRIYLIRR